MFRPAPSRPVNTVLQVVPRLDLGGVERGAIEIAEAVTRAGGRALVASAGGRLERKLLAVGGELVEMPAQSKNWLVMRRNASRLATLIRREGVDIVHARSRAPAWSAWAAARAAATPFVTTYHGVYSDGFPGKRFYNSVMARGRPVIAVSEFVAGVLAERHRLPPDRIVTIPRGADTDYFSEDAVSPQRAVILGQAWGIGDDSRPVLMLPGRLTRWKGHEHFLDAVARLRAERGPEAFLAAIVGEDGGSGYEAELLRRVETLGVGDCVRFAGRCDDMAAAYKFATVVVSASIQPEAFGRVAVEAQAMGRPVIATDHGGARETVAAGDTGWLYPPGDSAALAAAMGRALDLDAAARARMGRAGVDRVRELYTVRRMQDATLDVYEQVAGRAFPRR